MYPGLGISGHGVAGKAELTTWLRVSTVLKLRNPLKLLPLILGFPFPCSPRNESLQHLSNFHNVSCCFFLALSLYLCFFVSLFSSL